MKEGRGAGVKPPGLRLPWGWGGPPHGWQGHSLRQEHWNRVRFLGKVVKPVVNVLGSGGGGGLETTKQKWRISSEWYLFWFGGWREWSGRGVGL